MKNSSNRAGWVERSVEVIRDVLAKLPAGATPTEKRRALRDAYPFGNRSNWPYKAWLKAQRVALAGGVPTTGSERARSRRNDCDRATGELFAKPEGEMTPAEIVSEIASIVRAANARMMKADGDMRGLRPSEYDWMTREERERHHALKSRWIALVGRGESPDAARERVKARRAAKLEALRHE